VHELQHAAPTRRLRSGLCPSKESRKLSDGYVVRHSGFAVIAVLAFGLLGWSASTLGGASASGTGYGVTVGSARLAAAAIEADAGRLARHRPRRLPAARRAAGDHAIERLWLEGEARERGLRMLRAEADLALLRAQVADALAGARPGREASRFVKAFDRFHERWRSRTRCAPAYHDPYADRCGDRAPAAAGRCRWMGEATLCELGRDQRARWLVVQNAASARASWHAAKRLPRPLESRLRHARTESRSLVVRLRSRARAAAIGLSVYTSARASRDRAARKTRRARAAAAAAAAMAARRETRARERASRMRDPRLSEPALSVGRAACARQVTDSDPYVFGFGMQDPVGATEGLIAARAALSRRLTRAAQDAIDRRKLQPLLRSVAEGNRELAMLGAAEPGSDHAGGLVARFDAHTEREQALARRLDLGDCLVRPAR
jgi:hypothetical protein